MNNSSINYNFEETFKPENIGEISEGSSLNNVESQYHLDANEMDYVEHVLDRYDIAEISNPHTQAEKMKIIDSYIGKIRPNIPSKANVSFIGQNSKVWNVFKEQLEPKYLEAPLDKIQTEKIGETIYKSDELKFEKWKKYSLEQRIEVLNNFEQKMATICHRPAIEVSSERLKDGLLGLCHQGEAIILNEKHVLASSDNPEAFENLLETIIHEGRHGYQFYNVYDRLVHTSEAEVESWRENLEVLKYRHSEPIEIPIIGKFTYTNKTLKAIGARLYYYQPVEIDARNFATDSMNAFRNLANSNNNG